MGKEDAVKSINSESEINPMKHEEITKDIIGAAMAVLNALKPGLDEKLYENALVIELVARGHTVEQQREYPVYYRSHFIGRLTPDLIVDGKVIADPKVVSGITRSYLPGTPLYLTGTLIALGTPVGSAVFYGAIAVFYAVSNTFFGREPIEV